MNAHHTVILQKERKGASVYELLHGRELSKVLYEGVKGENHEHSFRLLKDEIQKAVALGFVREEEFGRWVYQE